MLVEPEASDLWIWIHNQSSTLAIISSFLHEKTPSSQIPFLSPQITSAPVPISQSPPPTKTPPILLEISLLSSPRPIHPCSYCNSMHTTRVNSASLTRLRERHSRSRLRRQYNSRTLPEKETSSHRIRELHVEVQMT
jgi:hypothetical protein